MKRAAAGALVIVALVSVGYLLVVDEGEQSRRGLAPVGDQAFGPDDVIEGATRSFYSTTGSRLAVLNDEGLGMADGGKIRPITAKGTKVVDAAWFPNAKTLLVAEGPVPTGALAVVDSDGTVRGTVLLEPSVGFGPGYGMAVAPGGRQAIVTAVDRPALGAEERRLVVVDLESGATRDLTPPGGTDESRPFYLDESRVAFTERSNDKLRSLIIDLTSGDVEEVAGSTSVAGFIGGEPVLQDGRRRVLLPGSPARVLGTAPVNTSITSVDPSGGQAVVVETAAEPGGGGQRNRLRRIELARPIRSEPSQR